MSVQDDIEKPGVFHRLFGTFLNAEREAEYDAASLSRRRKYGFVGLGLLTFYFFTALVSDALTQSAPEAMIVAVAARGQTVLLTAIGLLLLLARRMKRSYDLILFLLSVSFAINQHADYYALGRDLAFLAFVTLTGCFVVTATLLQKPLGVMAGVAIQWASFVSIALASGDAAGNADFLFIVTINVAMCALYTRRQAKAARRDFAMQAKLQKLSDELQHHMTSMMFEHEALERVAADNAQLADDLELARIEAQTNSYFLKGVLENIGQGVLVFDNEHKLAVANPEFRRLLDLPEELTKPGTPAAKIIQFGVDKGFYPDAGSLNMARQAIADFSSGRALSERMCYERAYGDDKYVEVRRCPLPEGGSVTTYTDITERRRQEEIIRQLAMNDPLTGLANRNLYAGRLQEAIARAKRNAHALALALLDLDKFKPVNDTYGHPVGDALLCEVSKILQDSVREVDTVARLGGDEFAIIFDGIRALDDVAAPIKRIHKRLNKSIEAEGHKLRIGVSIGIAIFPLDGATADALAKAADSALYAAKEAGRNRYFFAQPDLSKISKIAFG